MNANPSSDEARTRTTNDEAGNLVGGSLLQDATSDKANISRAGKNGHGDKGGDPSADDKDHHLDKALSQSTFARRLGRQIFFFVLTVYGIYFTIAGFMWLFGLVSFKIPLWMNGCRRLGPYEEARSYQQYGEEYWVCPK